EALLHDRLELGERLSGQRIDIPGLQIAAGRGARCSRQQILDDVGIDRLVEEMAAGDAGIDRFKDIHVLLVCYSSLLRLLPHPEERPQGASRRMGRVCCPWFETHRFAMLLTMRLRRLLRVSHFHSSTGGSSRGGRAGSSPVAGAASAAGSLCTR